MQVHGAAAQLMLRRRAMLFRLCHAIFHARTDGFRARFAVTSRCRDIMLAECGGTTSACRKGETMQRKQTGRLGLEEAAAFNTALDTNERLKRGLDDLACAYPELTQDEYVDEMLRLFKQAGLFLTREELETLLMLRRQTDLLLLRNDKT